jgi:hypothetical protein
MDKSTKIKWLFAVIIVGLLACSTMVFGVYFAFLAIAGFLMAICGLIELMTEISL